MNKIPTAKEFIQNYEMNFKDGKSPLNHMLIEFTKLHVKAALEAAYNKSEIINIGSVNSYGENCDFYEVDKDSILNAYPENLIV